MEQDFQRYREMSPAELKSEFLTIFEMLPKGQPAGDFSRREHSEVRFRLLDRLARIMERSSFSLACQGYFEHKRFFDYWVKGFDPESASGASFANILGMTRGPDFDITDPMDTKAVELVAFADLNGQLEEVKKYEPKSYLVEVDKRHEIEDLKGFLGWWAWSFALKYREELFLPTT